MNEEQSTSSRDFVHSGHLAHWIWHLFELLTIWGAISPDRKTCYSGSGNWGQLTYIGAKNKKCQVLGKWEGNHLLLPPCCISYISSPLPLRSCRHTCTSLHPHVTKSYKLITESVHQSGKETSLSDSIKTVQNCFHTTKHLHSGTFVCQISVQFQWNQSFVALCVAVLFLELSNGSRKHPSV